MKSIIVIFVGLIAHVNQPGSLDNTAVLVRADRHKPQLLLPVNAVNINPNDDWLLTLPRPDDINDRYYVDLDGWTVTLSNTRGFFCNHPSEFLEHVPRLKTLLPGCGELKNAVRNRVPNTEFAAFFDYRGGHLETIDYLQKKLIYIPKGGDQDERCASCRVQYVADTHGGVAVLTFRKGNDVHEVRVPENSTIEVQNSPDIDTGSHFMKFYNVLLNCPDDSAFVYKSANDCDQHAICNRANPNPPFPFGDCTNSQYP